MTDWKGLGSDYTKEEIVVRENNREPTHTHKALTNRWVFRGKRTLSVCLPVAAAFQFLMYMDFQAKSANPARAAVLQTWHTPSAVLVRSVWPSHFTLVSTRRRFFSIARPMSHWEGECLELNKWPASLPGSLQSTGSDSFTTAMLFPEEGLEAQFEFITGSKLKFSNFKWSQDSSIYAIWMQEWSFPLS